MFKIISITAIVVIVNVLLMVANNQKAAYEEGSKIRLQKLNFFIGCICSLFFFGLIIFMSISSNETAELWVYFILAFFILMGLSLVAAYLNWFIVVNEKDFIYRTFWRKTYQINYSDISYIKISENIIIIHGDNKRFFIDPHAVGIETFIQKISKSDENISL